MKRNYTYRGFDVAVELESVYGTACKATLPPALGFIAVVHVQRVGASCRKVALLRLMADNRRPFATEVDALMAGFSAGQRFIDDTIAP